MTTKFPLKMSKRAFVCQLTLLIIDTYSNILIESPIDTNEMYSSVNEKRIYVIDITFGIMNSKRCTCRERPRGCQNNVLVDDEMRQCLEEIINDNYVVTLSQINGELRRRLLPNL